MKKVLLLLPLLLLGACDASSIISEDTTKIANANSERVRIYTDPETKVQYLIYLGNESGGMTVRVTPDGTPMIAE